MNKLLIGIAVLPFLISVALAGNPKLLSDAQMDEVTQEKPFVSPARPRDLMDHHRFDGLKRYRPVCHHIRANPTAETHRAAACP